MERSKILLAVLFVIASLGALAWSVHQSTVSDLDRGILNAADKAQRASSFTLPEVGTGRTVTLASETKRGPVVLDFWATWCGPCHSELPHLVAVSDKYKGRVQFFGVNPSDPAPAISAYQKQNGMTYPTLLDAHHTAAFAYGADAFPLVVVIDKNNRIRFAEDGYDPSEDLEKKLSHVLDVLLKE